MLQDLHHQKTAIGHVSEMSQHKKCMRFDLKRCQKLSDESVDALRERFLHSSHSSFIKLNNSSISLSNTRFLSIYVYLVQHQTLNIH